MMKKVIAILLSIMLLFSAALCEEIKPSPLQFSGTPVKIIVITDSEGFTQEYHLTAEKEIAELMDLYTAVVLGAENNVMTTDSYNSITFIFEDGTTVLIRINGDSLETEMGGQTRYFALENLTPIWQYLKTCEPIPMAE